MMRLSAARAAFCEGLLAVLPLTSSLAATGKFVGDSGIELDAPYVPTPQPIVDTMLTIASVGPARAQTMFL
jgi:hypothetical protein